MEPITRTIHVANWMSLVLWGSLLFVLAAKAIYYGKFLNFIILPVNNKYLALFQKKERLWSRFHVLMTLFFLINGALFIVTAWGIFRPGTPYEPALLFGLALLATIVFLSIKVILQLATGLIFDNYALFNDFVYKKSTYLNFSGFVLFAANVLSLYVVKQSQWVILLALFLFLAINLMGWLAVLKNSSKIMAFYLFYFILYLCTLEIAPWILIGNLVK